MPRRSEYVCPEMLRIKSVVSIFTELRGRGEVRGVGDRLVFSKSFMKRGIYVRVLLVVYLRH